MNGIELTAEQKMMVESVRKLRRSRFEARALEHPRGKVPFENLKDLAEIGIMGMSVPERFGGTECSVFDTVLVLEEVAKTCYVTAELLMGELGVQPRIIATYAPDHLKERYLPRVASGEGLLSICMTEPDAGTDVANYKTRSVISG
ncbi:acyl-CoA dehydrogenase family protein, partial [Rhizobiaceae sp. 2RAB30]